MGLDIPGFLRVSGRGSSHVSRLAPPSQTNFQTFKPSNLQTFKLSNLQTSLSFGAGDFAQNLLYPAVAMYLLFFYTEILGIAPSAAAAIFLAAQLVDFAWNPIAGALIDRLHPRYGKYRTWLVLAGLPLAVLAPLCFCMPFAPGRAAMTVAFAAAAYIAFSMLFTLVNVAYGALNASFTRDSGEVTVITSVRIFMANIGCLVASAGLPLLVAAWTRGGASAAPALLRTAFFMGLGFLPSFLFMPLVPMLRRRLGAKGLFHAAAPVAVAGMVALYIVSRAAETRPVASWLYVAQFVKASGIILATGCMWALVPDVVTYSERQTGRRPAAIVTAIMGVFFRLGMAVGKILPCAVLAWTGYASAPSVTSLPAASPNAWPAAMAVFALAAAACLAFSFCGTKERIAMDEAASSRITIADVWLEFRRNRPLRTLSLFFLLLFAMMSTGNAAGAYFMDGLAAQPPLAREGVRWLVCVIPAVLIVAAIPVISRFAKDVDGRPAPAARPCR